MTTAYKKTSEMTAAGTLDGTEQVTIVQAGASVRTTTAAIANKVSALGAYDSGTHTPITDDGASLGTTSKRWSLVEQFQRLKPHENG